MRSGLLELHSFSFSEHQLAEINCILGRDAGIVPIVLNFFQILTVVHRVHGYQKHSVPVHFETFSSLNQSALDDGVHVVSVPDVVDVLGEVIWQQCMVVQCRINESTS